MRSKTCCPASACSRPTDRRLHGELVDVGARDERLVAGAGHDDRPHAIVVLQFERGAAQLVEGLGVESVQNLGAVDA